MRTNNVRIASRLATWTMASAVFVLSVSTGRAQCFGSYIDVYGQSLDPIRVDGDHVETEGETWATGDEIPYWSLTVTSYQQLNGTNLSTADVVTEPPGYTAVGGWIANLNVAGPGSYRDFSDHSASSSVCSPYYSDIGYTTGTDLAVAQPTISVPGGGSGPYAFWYLSGRSSIDGYMVTASFTGNPNMGSCGGCTPTYSWRVVDNPGAVSFSSTNTTTPTLTSQRASGGAVYDTSVVFSVDGFDSPKTLINLNTPVGILVASDNQVSNPDSCSNPTVNGGYDHQYYYYLYDLWSYSLAPITTNEDNDSYTDDTTIGSSSWHRSSSWVDDSVWSNSLASPPTFRWFNSYEFVDHIKASQCSAGWTPPPVAPAGLSSKVTHVTQTWHTASPTTGAGVSLTGGTDTQQWYTDHGTR